MPELNGKTYWLVGASAGLGEAIARALDAEGASLILSARSGDKLADLAAELTSARVIEMDVTDQESVSDAAENAQGADGVIYCAGFYEPMKATEWDVEAATLMTTTNYLGGMNVIGRILPHLISRGAGHVVIIGSLSGFRGLPGAVGYGASKAALMHLAENLRIDLKGTGILVQRMNPGFIKTRLTEKNDFTMPQLMEPEAAAGHVVRAMKSVRFSTSFPRPFAWLFTVGQHLPISWFQRIFG